jgi:hypothetical protein
MKRLVELTVVLTLLVSINLLLGVTPGLAVDHSAYGTVLDRHVDGGYFDYESFMDNPDSRDLLNEYLNRMSTVELDSLSESEALAYWMNLYNAATLELIEKNYPVDSIRDIGGWFSGPWSIDFVETPRGDLTLDHIEHQIIRPEIGEPRIHFALVCAANSCPPLRAEPYRAGELDAQLQHQAKLFIESDKNQFTVSDGKLVVKLSSIFSWYGEDFGGESGVVRYVADFLSDRKQSLIRDGNYSVQYLEYDWGLNQTPGPYPPTVPSE